MHGHLFTMPGLFGFGCDKLIFSTNQVIVYISIDNNNAICTLEFIDPAASYFYNAFSLIRNWILSSFVSICCLLSVIDCNFTSRHDKPGLSGRLVC